uniref:NADP-dependent oxidoreductase domain-containing protein n=1 Tax=Plectus sambesii TaxID=2011161 RepID=A0A914WW58_9BILA
RTRVQFPLRAAPHPTKVLIPLWVGELVAAMLRWFPHTHHPGDRHATADRMFYSRYPTGGFPTHQQQADTAKAAFTSLARQDPSLINDPVVVSLAEKHKTSINLILLAYALVQNIGILPKSVTPSRIQENFGVVNVKLTKEEVEQLTGLNRDKNYTLCQGWTVA